MGERPARKQFSRDKLAAAIERQGLSMHEMGRRVNPRRPNNGRSWIYKVLKGQTNPTDFSVDVLARAVGVPKAELLDDEEEDELERALHEFLLSRAKELSCSSS